MFKADNLFNSVKITDNLYCYIWMGMGNNCNSCLFTNVLKGDKPHVLIDPGHIQDEMGESCFQNLVDAMNGDGFNIEDVGMIINTHSHTDHCEANEIIAQNNDLIIALTEEEEKFRHTLGKRLDSMFGIRSPKYNVSMFIKEGNLNLGDHKVELQTFITPGHSPGSVCLYWPSKKILITGDVVFFGSVGRTDFPGGDTLKLKQSIDRLSELDVECLIPGHSTEMGNIITDKKNIERNFRAIKLYF